VSDPWWRDSIVTILAISPHPDDVEIGCFGTLARLAPHEPVVIVVMTSGAVRGSPEDREQEARESAALIGATVEFLRYADGSLVQNAETVGRVRTLMKHHHAALVFAPFAHDTHQDHAAAHGIVVASAAHTGEILLYETPSTFAFLPNVFYDITATLSVKQRALALFKSQADRPYLDPALVDAQARYSALRLHEKGKAFEAFALFRSVR
jgi:LmbE family N-acetylglucosaminyl deacetylase